MAISFTRPDPSSPSSVASASFTTARKGFEPSEVREFLRMVAAELARLQERERFLERELRTAQRSTAPSSVALDEELVTKMLGEEAARILHTSRDAASQIKQRAEEGAARLLREATDEAQRLREEAEIEAARRRADATADAESELEMAKQQGREMVNEARAYRERVLNELARRREIARQQIEQLVHGRDRLLQAFERSRLVAVDVMAELTPLGEPNEYVNLSPTTGPVPLMLPNMPRPGSEPAAAPSAAGRVAPAAERSSDTEDPTVALAVSHVVPLVETERPATTAPTDAGTSTDASGAPDEPVAIFVDADVEAERAAERARRDAALARETDVAAERPTTASTVITVITDVEIEVTDETDATDAVEGGPSEIVADESDAQDAQDAHDDTVVRLGIAPATEADHDDVDDRVPAPVVNLFGNERARTVEAAEEAVADDTEVEGTAEGTAEIDTDDRAVDHDGVDDHGDGVDTEEPRIDAVEIDDVEAEELAERVVEAGEHDVEANVDPVADPVVDDASAPEVPADPDATIALSRTSADDLFARLRAARAESVAQRAAAATQPTRQHDAEPTPAPTSAPVRVEPAPTAVVEDPTAPAVFQRSATAPVVAADAADTPFARRDEALTPLIVAAARKLKRVLADEQNEVLHALRRKEPVRALDVMLADERAQGDRYAAAIAAELVAAATAGAASMGADATSAGRAVERERATASATKLLVSEIVLPLRERLARCVTDADGDNGELATLVRLVYREWKNQRIDEQLDDIARTAFGRGALAGVAPGTPICWLVDPNGPECADAEDNALGGAVPAGEGFPTDHPCAPAHNGCRCMIARVD